MTFLDRMKYIIYGKIRNLDWIYFSEKRLSNTPLSNSRKDRNSRKLKKQKANEILVNNQNRKSKRRRSKIESKRI